jgi:hypothetical protein
MNIETIAVADLSLDPSNVRKHSRRNLDAIKASLRKFGQQKPIVVDAKGIILAGNGTLTAAKELGWTEIEIVRTQLEGVEATMFAIADNRTAELAEWEDSLAEVLQKLQADGHDLGELGYKPEDLRQLSKNFFENSDADAEPQIDKADELRVKWGVELGQLWELGDHRILCGDSTEEETVINFMGEEKADMVFTDPPYGVNIRGGRNNTTIAGDITQTAIPFAFAIACDHATTDDARLYFCGGEQNIGLYGKLFEKYCRQLPRHLIWVKNGFTMKPNGYHNQYEIVFHGYKPKGGGLNKWFGARTEDAASDVWQIKRDASSTYLHPTQKPIDVPRRAIGNSCPPKGIVFEPFSGSASTLMACENLGRKCRAIEISPDYVAVAIQRWADATGKTPVKS